MLVGDIYGDRDYSSIGLSATTIASSFGKVIARGLSSLRCQVVASYGAVHSLGMPELHVCDLLHGVREGFT